MYSEYRGRGMVNQVDQNCRSIKVVGILQLLPDTDCNFTCSLLPGQHLKPCFPI